MEKFFIDHWEIVSVLFGLIFSWFAKLFWKKYNKIDEIEKNYLDRFTDMKDDNHEKHGEVIKAIGDLGLQVVRLDEKLEGQVNVCKLIQDQKKNR